MRGVLWRAASSSPAALASALRRYRLLLLHAQDAAEAGVRVGRAALRSWVGEVAEQTALWPLLDDDGDVELRVDDLDALDAVVALAGVASGSIDAKAARLRDIVGDGRRTIVFTAARETVPWLRDRLAPERIAWCTGAQAGIGHVHLARGDVLAAFRPGARERATSPRVLVTTDVAAEGLDLQLAERVIHYDLPWTAMRLEQREGRAARIGAPHAVVEVVRFDPPAQLEARLRQSQILVRKARLPARAGLADTSLRRWREVLDAASGSAFRTASESAAYAAATTDEAPGVLAGLCLIDIGRARSVGGVLIWLDGDGRACSDPLLLASRLELAARQVNAAGCQEVPQRELDRTLRHLAEPSRALLRAAHGASWARRQRSPAVSRLAERLIRLGRDAARRRDGGALDTIDHGLRFLARGHTAGERMLIEDLAVCPAPALSARLAALPPGLDPSAYEVRLAGIILFRSGSPRLR